MQGPNNSKFIQTPGGDATVQFKATFYAEVSRLDDSVKDETKEKWYNETITTFTNVTRLNVFLLAAAFIIRMRLKPSKKNKTGGTEANDKGEKAPPTLTWLLNHYATFYGQKGTGTNVTTDIYKYYRHIATPIAVLESEELKGW